MPVLYSGSAVPKGYKDWCISQSGSRSTRLSWYITAASSGYIVLVS